MYSKKPRPLVVAGIILHSYRYALVVIARDSTNTHKASKASNEMSGELCMAKYAKRTAMTELCRKESVVKPA